MDEHQLLLASLTPTSEFDLINPGHLLRRGDRRAVSASNLVRSGLLSALLQRILGRVAHKQIADPIRHTGCIAGCSECVPAAVVNEPRIVDHAVDLAIDPLAFGAVQAIAVSAARRKQRRPRPIPPTPFFDELQQAIVQHSLCKRDNPPRCARFEIEFHPSSAPDRITILNVKQVDAETAMDQPDIACLQLRDLPNTQRSARLDPDPPIID